MPFGSPTQVPFTGAFVVPHIACARVDIFDHYEITVS
jgi:hypothetical protein